MISDILDFGGGGGEFGLSTPVRGHLALLL